MIAHLVNSGVQCTGFFAEGLWQDDGKRASFNLVTLPQNIVIPLSNRENTSWEQHGLFRYNPEALAVGKQLLENATRDSIIFIDEIGKQELDGLIWADAFENVLHRNTNTIVITVRKSFLEDVVDKWHLNHALVVDATTDCPEEIAKTMVSNNS
jgi:nucleoside-triphosphatase THEP1